MNATLACAVFCALLAPRAAENDSTSEVTPSARGFQVLAHRGRVELVGADGRVRLAARGLRLAGDGSAHLEAGAGASVEVTWPQLGSVRFVGPCVVEWGTAAARVARSDEVVLDLRCTTLTTAEFELRGALLALELPSGWRVNAARGALACTSAGSGRVRVAAHAGDAVIVDGPTRSTRLWPRRSVAPGAELTIDPREPARSRADRTRSAPPWEAVAWPWGGDVSPRSDPAPR